MSQVIIAGDTSGTITLQAPAVAGTTTLTLPATSGTILQSGTVVTEAQGGTGTTTGYYGFKNRIINGAMVIDQRNAGASVTTGSGANVYTLDRWNALYSQTSKFTVQQNAGSVTTPIGFSNYLGVTSSSAYSVLSGDYFSIRQLIEGYNVADLAWGTANAKTVTLSFQVYSSLTGTFGGALSNGSQNRSYPFTYTISSANTWTQISVTVAGDTSGTWLTNNGSGIMVFFSLGMGSTYSGTAGSWAGSAYLSATGATSVVGTNNATFYITGVQLEKGSTATSFDYRPYSAELAMCYRYYWLSNGTVNTTDPSFGTGASVTSTVAFVTITNPVTMRSAPTLISSGTFNFRSATALAVSAISLSTSGTDSSNVQVTTAANTAGYAGILRNGNSGTAAVLAFSSEL